MSENWPKIISITHEQKIRSEYEKSQNLFTQYTYKNTKFCWNKFFDAIDILPVVTNAQSNIKNQKVSIAHWKVNLKLFTVYIISIEIYCWAQLVELSSRGTQIQAIGISTCILVVSRIKRISCKTGTLFKLLNFVRVIGFRQFLSHTTV